MYKCLGHSQDCVARVFHVLPTSTSFRVLDTSLNSKMNQTTSPQEHTEVTPSPLLDGMIRVDAKLQFADSLERIYDFRVPILRRTTLPPGILPTDLRVRGAFEELDAHISNPEPLVSRLGYVQLTRLMNSLKSKIKADRQSRRVFQRKKSNNIAVDLYLNARGQSSDQQSRQQTHRQHRKGKRVSDLSGGTPLLIITHSD